ncbi:large exoprotein [Microbacterium rhizosphaerae]|uniref:Large exoprotein n=1 Tax=Microbacterium rhizosphaerae TaxID=1678237 RepID=A0ABZ0SN63_9MICO|nr:large exoprotein [Microbacterium rhizosphaerae]WPR88696.1 large exoprotein [Microbacterium rhizosphaerae]
MGGGQVLGGGVIALVAVLLWLVYLLPSMHSRYRFDAAERNAVRLNQALRVLAETSETPEEVHLELSARTALAQQRLAKQVQEARHEAELAQARGELERARIEQLRASESERAARVAARRSPEARRTRARRRARLTVTTTAIAAVGLALWGAWEVVTTGAQLVLWSSVVVALACMLVRARMMRVESRAVAHEQVVDAAPEPEHVPAPAPQTVEELADQTSAWTPRQLPRPLTARAGSRAAVERDVVDAREALRQAALEEALRAEAERRRPPQLRPAADDAEIEAHVRELLRRRAAG